MQRNVSVIPLSIAFHEAAQRMMPLVTNATWQEGVEGDTPFVAVEGEWQALALEELDVWGGHMKFVFKDNHPTTEEDKEARRQIALQVPHYAVFAASLTLFSIYTLQGEPGEWQNVTTQFVEKVRLMGW